MKKIITCSVAIDDLLWLKQRGISRSKLLRQAVEALKEERLVYNYIEVEE